MPYLESTSWFRRRLPPFGLRGLEWQAASVGRGGEGVRGELLQRCEDAKNQAAVPRRGIDLGIGAGKHAEAALQTWSVVMASRSAVFVDAGIKQGVTLQVEQLAAVRLGDSRIADQHSVCPRSE